MTGRGSWGQLADADRRRVFAAIELGAGHVADVLSRTGLREPRATKALARLVDSGLVVASPAGSGFAVDHSTFTAAARELLVRPPSTEHDDRPTEVRSVFAAFVRDGRITGIPTARTKRLVLLDWLAQRFDPGRRYPEPEVNAVLGEVHDDVAAWRRYLVDEGFLGRTPTVTTGASADRSPSTAHADPPLT